MKIRVLDSACQDLEDGFNFYEKQESGLGDYFIDSLFSDIDSLQIYAGIHPMFSESIIGCLQSGFPSLSTIK